MDDPRALSFGAAAYGYAQARPAYPARIAAWLAPGAEVVDVGAGTGKLTAVLLAAGRRVIAVEPDPQMLATLRAAHPDVEAYVAPAEALPLAAASVDAVVFGQAWHWVDERAAAAEAARVLKPGGTIGAIWNVPDEAAPWVAALQAVRGRSKGQAQAVSDAGPGFGEQFGPALRQEEPWAKATDVDGVVALMATRSEILLATNRERTDVLAEVRRIAEGAANAEHLLELPYRTIAYRATRMD